MVFSHATRQLQMGGLFRFGIVVYVEKIVFTHVKPVDRRIPARMVETVDEAEGSANAVVTMARGGCVCEEDLLRMASTP
jgi:hypothetical protein